MKAEGRKGIVCMPEVLPFRNSGSISAAEYQLWRRLDCDRNLDIELRAPIRMGGTADLTMVPIHNNLVANGEAQPRAFTNGFGGKEGIKNML